MGVISFCCRLLLDTVLRCCPTQDHNFYIILRNTTHNNGITFFSILLLYFHIIILIITVNELMINNERIYVYIYIKILKKMFDLCTESWTKSLKIDFKSSLSVLSLWT